jgi:isoleucyl-tRNA synthetase
VADADLRALLARVDLAEIAITSGATVVGGQGPAAAFRLEDVPGVAVEPHLAEGRKCARSWKISATVGSDPEFPDVTPRDAEALRELRAAGRL